jgi:hypothetical protein
MTMALEVLYVAHVFYYTAMYYLMSRSALYIPITKARGFTAHFWLISRPLVYGRCKMACNLPDSSEALS